MFQVVAIFAIFYFVMIRPQQKQRKQHEERLRNLKRGDEVVTAGGIVGEVVHIAETPRATASRPTMDDRITIKSGESRLIVERGRIARVLTAAEPARDRSRQHATSKSATSPSRDASRHPRPRLADPASGNDSPSSASPTSCAA